MKNRFEENFYKPPKEFSPAPLWFWYGKLEKDKLSEQIDEMVDKGVYNAFMHPRAYLITQYLEDEWWEIIDHVITYSQQKGFHPWLYDEYAWPSGTAGSTFIYSKQKPSRVLAEGECNMAKGLRYTFFDFKGPVDIELSSYQEEDTPTAVIIMQMDDSGHVIDSSLTDVSKKLGSSIKVELNHFKAVFFYKYTIPTAVDYLNKDTIQTFIKYTHEEYKRRYGKHFGKLIPGLFFDEIFNAASEIVWTDTFNEEFVGRKGYDLTKYLPLLIYDGGDLTKKVRKDYYTVLSELYEEAFFKPISKWCEQNNLMLTGHTEESLAEHPLRQGDYFRTMRHLHIPGGDCHDYRYKYPRKITPIEPKGAVSVARLNGRKRMMSEAMGGGGWATSLQEFKRGINVLAAMGINLFVLHGFYCETGHQGSQGDWPTSFFFQNPYWKNFKIFSEYISRLSFMGTIGEPVCKVGLLYPIAFIHQRFRDGKVTEAGKKIAGLYNAALENLLYSQVDTDVIDELSICEAEIADNKLCVGSEAFEVIVMPDAEGLDEGTIQKLQKFEKNGGCIVLYTCSEEADISQNFNGAVMVNNLENELVGKVKELIRPDFEIIEGDYKDIYYYHRVVEDKDYYLVVNADDTVKTVNIRFEAVGKPQKYNIETGIYSDIHNYLVTQGNSIQIPLSLMEDEAYFIVFNNEKRADNKKMDKQITPIIKELDQDWTVMPISQEKTANITDLDWESELVVPIALFRSSLDMRWKYIRIQNRRGEAGSCGRHLSKWKAYWITRRPSWADESYEKTLYFRKTVEISEPVITSKVCIAAVNRFDLYINGNKVCNGTGWCTPTECDITDYLHVGKNLIAIRIENDTPIQGKNMLEVEEFNPDTLTSLLLEGYVQTKNGLIELYSDKSWITCSAFNQGWQTPALDAEARAQNIDVRGITFPWNLEYPHQWIVAWERGTPPIQPWGTLPLFGSDVEFPVQIQYQVLIPCGTKKIFKPRVKGNWDIHLEDKKIDDTQWDKGYIFINDSKSTHTLRITVETLNFSDGVVEPIKVSMSALDINLGDWRKIGVPFYSGSMIYNNRFTIDNFDDVLRCEIDLGKVNFHAEVWVNGKLAGTKLWKPYKLDITDFILPGENDISVMVSNLAANEMRYSLLDEGKALGWNRYWYEENIDRDSQNLESGLFGPVRISIIEK